MARDLYCRVCDMELLQKNCGRRYCGRCHAQKVRTVYLESRNRSVRKWQAVNGEKKKKSRIDSAERRCGVRSYTSLASKNTERAAYARRLRWTADEDAIARSEMTELEVSATIGRTLRGVQHRRATLRNSPL